MKRFLLFMLALPFIGFAQNDCTTAVAASVGVNSVGMIDGTAPTDICGSVQGPGQTAGEWYTFTATVDGVVNITTDLAQNDGVTNSDDTRIIVYTGSCGALTCLAENDDISNTNYLSDVTFMVASGTTYTFVWDDRWSDSPFDFELTETAVSCFAPDVTFDDFTMTTADISWADVGDYEIEYGEYPYTQGGGGMAATVTAGNTYTLTGLTSGIAYTVFVRQNCGGGSYSDWSEVVVGTTPEVVNSYPYSDDLEVDANQFYILNLGLSFAGDTGTWNYFQDNLNDGNTANDFAQSPIGFIGSSFFTDADYDAYIFMPAMELTAGNTYNFSFSHRVLSDANTTVPMDFEVVVSGTNDGMGTTILQSYTDLSNLTYTTYTVSYVPTTTGTHYFGFHNNTNQGTGATTNNYNLIDDILIDEVLGVEDVNAANGISTIYPNPAKDVISIRLADNFDATKTKVEIADMNGRIVMNADFAETMNVSNLTSGVYIMTITDGINTENQKFIKE